MCIDFPWWNCANKKDRLFYNITNAHSVYTQPISISNRRQTDHIALQCKGAWYLYATVCPSHSWTTPIGRVKKPDHFWKSVTPVYDEAERWYLYQSVQCFIWSKTAGVHLSQLNIHCTSMVKPHYSKNDDSSIIHLSHVTTIFYVFSMQRIGFRRYIKTFSTLSEVRIMFWVLPQLDILCTIAVKRHYTKNDNSPFKCHFPVYWSSWQQEKLATE